MNFIMKKKPGFFAALPLLCLFLCLLAASAALAAGEQRVFDQAGLLSQEQAALLEERIAGLRQGLDVDIVLLTADTGVYDTQDYADVFYEEGDFGARGNATGVLYFIDMENRTAWISTTGDMIDLIDDPREEAILDAQMGFLAEGDYYGAFGAALDWTETYGKGGVGPGHYAYDESTGEGLQPGEYGSSLTYAPPEKERPPLGLAGVAGCLALGAGAGFLARGIVKARYNKAFEPAKYAFREKSSLNLTVNSSVCTGKFVTTRVIPKAPPPSGGGAGGGFSGGGSGVHTSSGGGTHGGGGRHF